MDYFPAFLKLEGKPVLLVGGGSVAARKARLLAAAGARLTVVSPKLHSTLESTIDTLVRARRADYYARRFRPADVDGQWLVVSATGEPIVDRWVAATADEQRVFCNVVDDKESCSYITPAVVDRSPLVVAISSAGTAPVLARQVRSRIEALLPAKLGELAALAGRWRERVKNGLGGFATRLRFWQRVFDGPIASDVYAGYRNRAENKLATLLDEYAQEDGVNNIGGEAWLVGAGPGDQELLTLKAVQAMQRADVILHDRLVSEEVLELARRDAEFMSVGKTPGCTANSQKRTSELLVRLVGEGKRVCRLKGGDPFIFGRGGEEAEALAEAGLRYTVVPGITAAAGCAAAAGIPLTHRDLAQSVVFVTGHGKNSVDTLDWASLARGRQTLAVYMGVRRFRDIMHNLTSNGRPADTPVAIIERGTLPGQRVIRGTLGQLPMLARANGVGAPAMLIVGDVARLGREFSNTNYSATAAELTSSPRNSAIQG